MKTSINWQGKPDLVRHRRRLIQNYEASCIHAGYDITTLDYEGAQEEFEKRNWYRASASVVCELCGLKYGDHPQFPYSFDRGTLNSDTELCNGDLVHL